MNAIILDELSFEDFQIEEVEDIEALSDTAKWWFAGLGAGVVVGIAAC